MNEFFENMTSEEKLAALRDPEYIKSLNIDDEQLYDEIFGVYEVVRGLDEEMLVEFIKDDELLKRYRINPEQLLTLICNLESETQFELLKDLEYVKRNNLKAAPKDIFLTIFEYMDSSNIRELFGIDGFVEEINLDMGILKDLVMADKDIILSFNQDKRYSIISQIYKEQGVQDAQELIALLPETERLNIIHKPEVLQLIGRGAIVPYIVDSLSPEARKSALREIVYDIDYLQSNSINIETLFKILDDDLIYELYSNPEYINTLKEKISGLFLRMDDKKNTFISALQNKNKDTVIKIFGSPDIIANLNAEKSNIVDLFMFMPSDTVVYILKQEQDVLKELNIDSYDIEETIRTLPDEVREKLIKDDEYWSSISNVPDNIQKMFEELSDEEKLNFIEDKDRQSELRISGYQLSSIINGLSEEMQLKLVDKSLRLTRIIDNGVDVTKLLKPTPALRFCVDNSGYRDNISSILAELSSDEIIKVFIYNKEFFAQNINSFDLKIQRTIVDGIETLELDEKTKNNMLIKIDQSIKDELIKEGSSYSRILALKYNENDVNILDLTGDLEEKYKGLDEYLYVNPRNFEEEDKAKFDELCQICPNMKIVGGWKDKQHKRRVVSTVQEYKDGEEWINSVLEGINPNWTDIQKVAYIDHAIGTRISYAPEYESEIYNWEDNAAIWKTASRTYGVCAGVAALEAYMLERAGIEVEEISSEPNEEHSKEHHAFLKINIRIKMPDGSEKKVSTLIDPTWNMAEHMYGLKPEYFCLSYEEIAYKDSTQCHVCKKFRKKEYATVGFDENSSREAFSSIGVADEDGNFPAKKHLDKLKEVMQTDISDEEKMSQVFNTVATLNPKFAETQDSTIDFLRKVMRNNRENMQYNKFVTDRVYDKEDESKTPIMYVYMDYVDGKKSVYVAVHGKEEFEEMSVEEFEQKYVCYDKDLEKNEGKRPWEELKTEDKDIIDL